MMTTAIIATRPLVISASPIMPRRRGESHGCESSGAGVTMSRPSLSFFFVAPMAATQSRTDTVNMLTSTPGLKMPPVCRAGARLPSASWFGRPRATARDSCVISASGRPTAPSIASRPTTSSSFRDFGKFEGSLRPRGSKSASCGRFRFGTAGVFSSAFRPVDVRGRRLARRGLRAADAAKPTSEPLASCRAVWEGAERAGAAAALAEDATALAQGWPVSAKVVISWGAATTPASAARETVVAEGAIALCRAVGRLGGW
mmetsp:Transcript_15762/g.34596  ORF Transcript_15762/g.34596 Transcript_15762/m.34596 type:complete len:259 (-) Transcript_15762:32-808(-)